MKKQIIQIKKNTLKVFFAALLFLFAGAAQINAQNLAMFDKSEIPQELISPTKYSITKSVQPELSFDSSTPYFDTLEVVDYNNQLLATVIATNVTNSDSTVINRVFDFSRVSPATYYAKGELTGAIIYYQIDVKN